MEGWRSGGGWLDGGIDRLIDRVSRSMFDSRTRDVVSSIPEKGAGRSEIGGVGIVRSERGE